jgi:hypothetical protein
MESTVDKSQALLRLSELHSGRFWKQAFETLSPPEKVFRAIWELETEVNNGGFDQYFFGPGGDSAKHAISALEEVGAPRMAGIVQRALRVFGPDGPAPDRAERQRQLDALDVDQVDALDDLDAEFYLYPENLTELLFDFVGRHRSQVRGADEVL